MNNKDNLLDVVKTLFRWKRPILSVCLIALAGSIAIALLLPVYYEATTTFLAASPDQAKPEMLYGKVSFEPEYYGNENDIDRILTLAESGELVDHLIDSFQLYEHYDIDTSGARAAYWVRETFFGHYEVAKTKRDAIDLSIEDTDKVLAANMANAAREKIDRLAQQLIKESQYKSMRAYELNIRNKEQQLAILSDSLVNLRRTYGIFNTEAQSESLTDQLSKAEARLTRNEARLRALRGSSGIRRDTIANLSAMVDGQTEEVAELQQKIAQLNEGMAIVNTLERQYSEANQSLGEDKERYKLLASTYQSDIPATILVEKASVPIIKSRPRRSIIVVASVAVAFLFSVIGVLLFDAYKDINWREIIHAQ